MCFIHTTGAVFYVNPFSSRDPIDPNVVDPSWESSRVLPCVDACATVRDIGLCCDPQIGCLHMQDVQCSKVGGMLFPYTGNETCDLAFKNSLCGRRVRAP